MSIATDDLIRYGRIVWSTMDLPIAALTPRSTAASSGHALKGYPMVIAYLRRLGFTVISSRVLDGELWVQVEHDDHLINRLRRWHESGYSFDNCSNMDNCLEIEDDSSEEDDGGEYYGLCKGLVKSLQESQKSLMREQYRLHTVIGDLVDDRVRVVSYRTEPYPLDTMPGKVFCAQSRATKTIEHNPNTALDDLAGILDLMYPGDEHSLVKVRGERDHMFYYFAWHKSESSK